MDVAVCVGSLRRESFTRKVANALLDIAPLSMTLTIVEIGELPLYNQDLEEKMPGAWLRFRERIARADAVLFVTPEYNRSLPGGLKNALDVRSRPYGHSAWDGKPAAIISVSPGALGGFGAQHHLRQPLVFLNMPAMQQPEVYLSRVTDLLGPDGKVANEGTRDFLRHFLNSFASWIAVISRSRAAVAS